MRVIIELSQRCWSGEELYSPCASVRVPSQTCITCDGFAKCPCSCCCFCSFSSVLKSQAVLDYLQQHPTTITSQAMQYDADPTTELPACIHGLKPADVVPNSAYASSHMAQVITALLYVACGGLDQAHNLVTPLCWGSWTPYAGESPPHDMTNQSRPTTP